MVMTVAGPVEPATLGPTLVHEHLLIDLRHSSFVEPPGELAWIADSGVADVDPAVLARNSCSVQDNLVLRDEAVAICEATRFRDAGGRTIVDVTPADIGRSPEGLRRIAESADVHVVMGCGHYCEIAHGPDLATCSEDDLMAEIVRDVQEGVGGTGIRAGIIGELGVNGEERMTRRRVGEMTETERRVLRAGARASALTGAPMTVHLPSRAAAVAPVLDELEAVGAPPERISLSHMDTIPDVDLHEAVLERGVWIQYDCFGMALENDWYNDPGDGMRCDWLARHRDRGHLDRVLVSHDVWSKGQLACFGGGGYAHLLTRVVPMLADRGFSEADVRNLLVEGPTRFLTFGDAKEEA